MGKHKQRFVRGIAVISGGALAIAIVASLIFLIYAIGTVLAWITILALDYHIEAMVTVATILSIYIIGWLSTDGYKVFLQNLARWIDD